MKIVFYNRNFTVQPPDVFRGLVEVERYSWSVFGGPQAMTLSAPITVDKWTAFNLLRCPVEVYDEDSTPVWWGYINKVTIPEGQVRVSLDLSDMYNNVAVSYTTVGTTDTASTQAATAWSSNAISIAEYGTKEKIETLNDANATSAPYYRDKILNLKQYPVRNIDYGSAQKIQIDCLGWWQTLDWQYYSSTDMSLVDTVTQITNIINAEGQFITGVVAESLSGITSVAYRDPFDKQKTALDEAESLLAVGNNGLQRYTAIVNQRRGVLIAAEPAQSINYFMDEKGRIETLNSSVIPPARCPVGIWVAIKNIPATDFSTTTVRPVFVESGEYTVSGNKFTPQFAGSRDVLKITEIK